MTSWLLNLSSENCYKFIVSLLQPYRIQKCAFAIMFPGTEYNEALSKAKLDTLYDWRVLLM